MQANIAVGLLESSSIAKGIEASATRHGYKMASVKLVKTAFLARGKYTIYISGPVGEVESAMRAGRQVLDKTLVDEVLIRNVHKQVLDTLDKRVPVERLDAVGIIETKEAIATVLAADAAAKAASVRLIETRTVVGGGKGLVTMTGTVGDVRAAIAFRHHARGGRGHDGLGRHWRAVPVRSRRARIQPRWASETTSISADRRGKGLGSDRRDGEDREESAHGRLGRLGLAAVEDWATTILVGASKNVSQLDDNLKRLGLCRKTRSAALGTPSPRRTATSNWFVEYRRRRSTPLHESLGSFMLANLAVGFHEGRSILSSRPDAMCKMASVKLAKTAIIARGKFCILITGPVGEVESSSGRAGGRGARRSSTRP